MNPYHDLPATKAEQRKPASSKPTRRETGIAFPALDALASVAGEANVREAAAETKAKRDADYERNSFAHAMGGGYTD